MEVSQFLITEDATLIEALELLDRTAKKVVFVESNHRLVAALTDGDIRRWILKKGKLDANVKQIANYNPKFINVKDKLETKHFMKQHGIEALPVVNDDMEIISISLMNDEEIHRSKNLKIPVVIMAGGLGTRLYPYTKVLPKPLIPIGDLPIVEHIINRFNKFGVNDFHLVVNHKKNMIKAYFNEIEKTYNVDYADEDIPLGTGGGLSLLKGKLNSTFILTNCDILIEEDYEKIYQFHKKERNIITMVCSLKNVKIPYGVIEINDAGEIIEMKEKPEFTFFTNTGMYIVEPEVIQELDENTSIGFPDIIENHQLNGKKVGIFPIGESTWLDMGQIDEMEKMRVRLEKNE